MSPIDTLCSVLLRCTPVPIVCVWDAIISLKRWLELESGLAKLMIQHIIAYFFTDLIIPHSLIPRRRPSQMNRSFLKFKRADCWVESLQSNCKTLLPQHSSLTELYLSLAVATAGRFLLKVNWIQDSLVVRAVMVSARRTTRPILWEPH